MDVHPIKNGIYRYWPIPMLEFHCLPGKIPWPLSLARCMAASTCASTRWPSRNLRLRFSPKRWPWWLHQEKLVDLPVMSRYFARFTSKHRDFIGFNQQKNLFLCWCMGNLPAKMVIYWWFNCGFHQAKWYLSEISWDNPQYADVELTNM